jgi:hypothetical protein
VNKRVGSGWHEAASKFEIPCLFVGFWAQKTNELFEWQKNRQPRMERIVFIGTTTSVYSL